MKYMEGKAETLHTLPRLAFIILMCVAAPLRLGCEEEEEKKFGAVNCGRGS